MHARVAGPTDFDLKDRIIEFVGPASVEITTHERDAGPALAGLLVPGTSVYITQTPNTTVADIADMACEVERWGFRAWPHLVARRIESEAALEQALERMQRADISRALLVAGDLSTAAGSFSSTMDILASGALGRHGFMTLGVAGHPEGHKRVGSMVLWSALREKQDYAEMMGVQMNIVSQFSFDPGAVCKWDLQLTQHGITLPVHAGIAGPASLRILIRYAMLCGIGASLNALMTNLSALSSVRHLATTADEVLLQIVRARDDVQERRIVQPHFFSFGGVARTASWLRAIRAGAFEVDTGANTLAVDAQFTGL